jgi:DNA-binding winged helix-turn-helix (wHTH) protein/tetratricopeptide (TPR) repeat protein
LKSSSDIQIALKEPLKLDYEFGTYRLELSSRRLLRSGEPVALAPKAFDVLVALVERHDRVVDKAELMKLVWPESFVEEANLTQTVFVLRKTLGNDADGRPFIDTVPRRGYRFAAPVQAIVDAPSVAAVSSNRRIGLVVAGLVTIVVIAAAVVGWRMLGARSAAVDPLAAKTRIVVLPFENLTRDHNDDWLASAFSESLTAGLRDLDEVICISRDRIVELYRQQSLVESAPLDAEALRRMSQLVGAAVYVHGAYQRVGDQIRVTARLVDSATGEVRTQESATDAFVNLLKLEDDLSGRFGAKLAVSPSLATTRPATLSLEAYREVVEARTAYAAGDSRGAYDRLQRAVTLDPQYAQAWALLSRATARLAAMATFPGGSLDDLRRSALGSAQRAAALAPSLYEAHAALALAYRETGESELWRREAEQAISINPRLAEAYELLGDWYFAATGFGCSRGNDPVRAERYFRTALGLDPRFSVAWANLIYHLHSAGKFDEAMRVADDAARTLPKNTTVLRARATALLFAANRPADAEQEIRHIPERDRTLFDQWVLATVDLLRGATVAASKQLEAIPAAIPTTSFELSIAKSYFMANQIDQALTHVDRAVALNADCAKYAAATPSFAPYRDAPQFQARLAAWKSSR